MSSGSHADRSVVLVDALLRAAFLLGAATATAVGGYLRGRRDARGEG